MLELDGVTAWIEVDGRPLPEYEVVVKKRQKMVFCHIMSEAGKAFAVRWRWTQEDVITRGELALDGHYATESFAHESAEGHDGYIDYVEVDEGADAKPTFAEVQLTDDPTSGILDKDLVNVLGTIVLAVQRGVEREPSPGAEEAPEAERDRTIALPRRDEVKPIHESLKQAGAHQIILGETMNRPLPFLGTFEEDPRYKPVIFKFTYRPKDHLQANGIMPREPSTVKERETPLMQPMENVIPKLESDDEERKVDVIAKLEEHEEEEDGDGEAEAEAAEDEEYQFRIQAIREERERLAETVRRYQALEAEEADVVNEHRRKRGFKLESEPPNKKPKMEIRVPILGFKPGEVIDLTD